MRWLYAIPILVAFAEAGHSEPAHSERLDPCSAEKSGSSAPPAWPAKIRRDEAVNVVRHVRNACRIIKQLADSHGEQLRPQLNSVLESVRDEVLAPIYRTYPSLARTSFPNDIHPSHRATPKDIDRVTAMRLEHAKAKIQREISRIAFETADKTDSKQSAEAAVQPFVDASLELGVASRMVFEAYPDIWAKDLPNPPRTPESDANARKSAPPIGSVKLTAAALAYVREFMQQVRREVPREDWIASIIWATDRKSKGPNDANWTNHGDGLELGSYRRSEVPPDIIDKIDGVDIMFSAPDPSMLAGKTIDLQKRHFVIHD